MMKEEFESRIGREISTELYRIVECVYMWHPRIPNVNGKEVISELFKLGGMELMEDMSQRAKSIEQEDAEIRKALQENARRRGEIMKQIAELNVEFDKLTQETGILRDRLEALENKL